MHTPIPVPASEALHKQQEQRQNNNKIIATFPSDFVGYGHHQQRY
jgi:hypothetical protein